MANILAIDTATKACSAALYTSQQLYSEFKVEAQSHTRLILPMIDALLQKAGTTLSELDAITFTHGPGSFTGIRIGFGVVQGLALGVSVPVIPVSTLELMAATAVRKQNLQQGQSVLSALDARMNELYWGQYQLEGTQLVTLIADQLTAPEAAFNDVDTNPSMLGVGDGWNFSATMPIVLTSTLPDFYPEAEDLVPIALQRFQAGQHQAIQGLEPLYLRDKVSWKKRQRLRQ